MELEKSFDPELELSNKEQADLSAVIHHPGFAVALRLGRCMVDQFVVKWMNADSDEDVLKAHKHAKVSAQFFQGFVDRINLEAAQYKSFSTQDNKPIDITENLDMGWFATEEGEPY